MEYKHRNGDLGLFQYRIQYYRDYDEGTLQPADGSCIYLKELDHYRTKAKIPSDHARSNRKLPLWFPVTESPVAPSTDHSIPTDQPTSPSKERTNMTVSAFPGSVGLEGWGPERKVAIEKTEKSSFGFSIVGGKVNVGGDVTSGIFIKSIIPDSPADKVGMLKIGDRILAVNENSLENVSHEKAVNYIKTADARIVLVVQSLERSTNPMVLQKKVPPPITPAKTPDVEYIQDGAPTKAKAPEPPSAPTPDTPKAPTVKIEKIRVDSTDSENSSEDEEDSREMEGKTFTAAGVEIDRASAGNAKLTEEDNEEEDDFGYTTKKIRKRYAALGEVVCCTIMRDANETCGLSLCGHRDRNRMACLIAGINPKGAAAGTSLLVGDEVLEVNGTVLHGRCHLNCSVIIKNLASATVKFIVLRKKTSPEELAVKPVKHFPTDFDYTDNILEKFKDVRTITVKKGTSSLGIMIIEGKHSIAGQGIFISDIQEGSTAEKSGLKIGDMLLSVNRDSLLGCNYETAAGLLKKAEGVVSLKICNPNEKKEGDKKPNGEAAPSATPNKKAMDGGPEKLSTSRAGTPHSGKPEPSPVKEVVDPLKAPINDNEFTVIDIATEGKPLGIVVAGGNDSLVKSGAAVVDILPSSVAEKDNRLKLFDQIIEINGFKVNNSATSEAIRRAVKQLHPKVRIIVYRANPEQTETVEVDLVKKSGKNLGLTFRAGNPKGAVITGVVPGGSAEFDGRIQLGDIVSQINGESLEGGNIEQCASLLKTAQGKVGMRIVRPKLKERSV
ncbi:inactivation-no-after-potential D protein-like isoform X1 [Anopheles albimanus]|uniref:inactivation-no-after-potential D protein-like isoform X1 n=2 Tax=Anopheles albimanus TaxID=7167 RepID=UPI001641C89E|nr:inactivation-no-after-potential D protein-like isoform X1 [Anopheles albimanus]XP_035795279.1 inactivation-no-after-potential D protein-like isoform X1 [Anopheles albimanus]XP_035795280.1 inactivation-no-after-potential D protein-like isoform X1 [Anopheles albimanus]XP_035795281.1 inactivation-no-after-potential D protein-like isoform X1 [Anopheles albimanus]